MLETGHFLAFVLTLLVIFVAAYAVFLDLHRHYNKDLWNLWTSLLQNNAVENMSTPPLTDQVREASDLLVSRYRRTVCRHMRNRWRSSIDRIPYSLRDCWHAVSWIVEHPWLVSLPLVYLLAESIRRYYQLFGFDIRPYFADTFAGSLPPGLAVVVFALLVGVASVVLIVLAVRALLFPIAESMLWVSLYVLVISIGGTFARVLLWSVRLQTTFKLTHGLLQMWQYAPLLQNRAIALITGSRRSVRKTSKALGSRKGISVMSTVMKRPDRISWMFILLLFLFASVTTYHMLLVEPQYLKYSACREESRVIVVHESSERTVQRMVRIGSASGFVLAVPIDSCSSGANEVEQTGRLGVWRGVLGNHLRSYSGKQHGNRQFTASSSDSESSVVALAATRVRCMYEERSRNGGFAPCGELNTLPPAPPEENLLREQIADHLGGCAELVVSDPIVFGPGGWEEPVSNTDRVLRDFEDRLNDRSHFAVQRQELHVFGLASADGPSDYNRELAKRRAERAGELVEAQLEGWTTQRYAFGEKHLGRMVSGSRSALVVSCLQG